MTDGTEFEFEGVQTAREAATLLRELADGFDGGDRLEFGDGDASFRVPEEVTVEIETEREGDAVELELEFEWSSSDEGDESETDATPEEETDATPEGETTAIAEGDAQGENAISEMPREELSGPVSAGDVTSLARFQVYRDRGGKWRWRLVHRNGNIIATGGQGYASRQNALKGLRSVTANAVEAEIGFGDE